MCAFVSEPLRTILHTIFDGLKTFAKVYLCRPCLLMILFMVLPHMFLLAAYYSQILRLRRCFYLHQYDVQAYHVLSRRDVSRPQSIDAHRHIHLYELMGYLGHTAMLSTDSPSSVSSILSSLIPCICGY